MICPKCKKELGEGSFVDICTKGWVCEKCNIKIYDESDMYDNK